MSKAYFEITGSSKPLFGTLRVRGAKNEALKALASSLLFQTPITLRNVPIIEDVARTVELLQSLGVEVSKKSPREYIIDPRNLSRHVLDRDIARSLRASIVLVGPLLARVQKARFPYPGGCVIGKRPIDLFLDGWKAMGVHVREAQGEFELSVKRLRGCNFTFRTISVTGTETLMMTAALAHGTTVLRNVAMEPEIPHLAGFLNAAGARIEGAGTPTLYIEGTGGKLLSGGVLFQTLPDRIEAASFAALVAARGGTVKITHCNPEHLRVPLKVLEDIGVRVRYGDDWIVVSRKKKLKAVDSIKTHEYPGFVTDLQAPFSVLLTQAMGASLIFETIYDGRLSYVDNLNRMGAHITTCDPHRILVNGPTELRARAMESPDIRAGLAFVIAAAIARGTSRIDNLHLIDRGYENIDRRLRKIGVAIRRKKA